MSTVSVKNSETPKSVNYVDVLKNIEEFYTENAITAFCPTNGTSIKYKPLNVKQLKKFIELQVSATKDEFGVLQGLEIVSELNNVIVDNSSEYGDSLLDALTVIDRDAVLVQLRSNTKPTADVVIDDDVTDTVDLVGIVKNIKDTKYPAKLKTRKKTFSYGSGSITINIKLPSLRKDNDINSRFRKRVLPKLQKGRKQVEKEVDQIMSQVYFLEICKYIDTLEIKKGKSVTVIDFTNIESFDQNFLLLEELPTQIVTEVSGFMSDVRAFRDEVFCYENSDGKSIPLDIDIALFAGI
jgi:hypothetical protein